VLRSLAWASSIGPPLPSGSMCVIPRKTVSGTDLYVRSPEMHPEKMSLTTHQTYAAGHAHSNGGPCHSIVVPQQQSCAIAELCHSRAVPQQHCCAMAQIHGSARG
jgi:hypothetical protein